MRSHQDSLLGEIVAAILSTAALAAAIALLFWLTTGMSPWPFVILGEIAGMGFGISMLLLTSPRRRL